MGTPTVNQGIVLPDLTDGNNIPLTFDAYNDGVEPRLVQRYASAVDRGVRNPTPAKGELSYLLDVSRYETYDGSSWVILLQGTSHPFLEGETGTALFSFTSQSSDTQNIDFAVPFLAPPRVFTNIASGAGVTAQWDARAFSITPTSFTLFVFGPGLQTWSNVSVQWLAVP